MSSTNSGPRRNEPIARDARPLPSAPSLAYERKRAKALVKQLRGHDDDAIRRMQTTHPAALRGRAPEDVKLTDVQHLIAREYGFASWPRLVEYFEELERHRHAPRYNSSDDGLERLENTAHSIIRRHQRGDAIVARQIAHFVPRFYARSIAEILATPITMDEARLVVARDHRRASWDELIERADASRALHKQGTWDGADTPAARARVAMRSHDVDALSALLDEHPELLTPGLVHREWRQTLASMALDVERTSESHAARGVTEFLASRGVDVQGELDERLLGFPHDRYSPDALRRYLERGANPNWLPSNGIPVLEHAIIRYRNGVCVDLIAERVAPRRALWIAAGLGDAGGVRSFIMRKGKLTAEARINRPDPIAMGWFGLPPHHDADDLEIMWEAFQVAGWNGRWAAMDALLDAGLPVDHAPTGFPLAVEAAGNLRVPLAEYLITRGADVEREWSWPANGSVRSMARFRVTNDPKDEEARRLLALCDTTTPEELLAETESKRQSPPPPDERTIRAMQLAADDAARQGQLAVTTENMLVGILRLNDGGFASCFNGVGTDMPRLRAAIGARLLPDSDPLAGQGLPADASAQLAVQQAAAGADERRRESIHVLWLLVGILSQRAAPGAQLLAEVERISSCCWNG